MSAKIGRNDPCWCGSGKKYKVCHAAFDDKIAHFAQLGHRVPTRDLIKTPDQIAGIKESAKINVAVLDYIEKNIHAGMNTAEIDKIVYDMTTSMGGIPAPLNYEFLPEDATKTDVNKPDNYRYFLGTTIAPYTGGFNLSASWKQLKLSVSGMFSLGSKTYEKMRYPASYSNTSHSGVSTETVQSQFSDLYGNHLNVEKDRTNRWTPSHTTGVKYPRVYDYYDARYNFSSYNPMDYSIIDAVYLKNNSYVRIKSIILTYSLPSEAVKKLRMRGLSFNISMNNFFTFTGYDGMDPEIPGATYPTTRSVSGGINVEF